MTPAALLLRLASHSTTAHSNQWWYTHWPGADTHICCCQLASRPAGADIQDLALVHAKSCIANNEEGQLPGLRHLDGVSLHLAGVLAQWTQPRVKSLSP